MNKCDENLQQIKQKVIEKLKEDKLNYNPDIEEYKKFRKFFAIKTVDLETATAENIKDYSQCIYKTIKSYLADQEIKGTISFKIYGLENLRDKECFADLIRGIFYYQPVATNYDKIKNMTLDEMAELIGNLYGSDNWCDKCAEQFDDCYSVGKGCHCIQFAKQWLQQESEG